MFCPNCGSKLPDDARFCGSCGTRLQADQPPPKPQKEKKKGGKKVVKLVLMLLLGILLVYLVMLPIPVAQPVKGILFLLTAMPAGTVIAMQAEIFDGDAIFASRAIAWSTLLALITVPMMGMLL